MGPIIEPGSRHLERRKYPRFNVDLPVEYCRFDSSRPASERILNISEGGVLTYFHERMEIDQHLKLRLFFSSNSELKTIEMTGEVAWVDAGSDTRLENYRLGLKLSGISPFDLNILKTFLQTLPQSPYSNRKQTTNPTHNYEIPHVLY